MSSAWNEAGFDERVGAIAREETYKSGVAALREHEEPDDDDYEELDDV